MHRYIVAVGLVVGAITMDARAQEVDTTARTITIPAPEQGIIYIRSGRPGGVRIRSRRRQASEPRPAGEPRAAAAAVGAPAELDLSRLETMLARQGLDLDVALARRNGETVVVLRHRDAAAPGESPVADTLSVEEAVRLLGSFGGEAQPDQLGRADLPDLRRRVERSILDTGVFRSLHVNFAFDRSELLPTSDSTLAAVAAVLTKYPDLRIEVAGHADSIGTDAYNLRLSERRAEEVRRALIARGIDPPRLEAVGYGEERPVLSNSTPTGRAMNRRVEFVLLNPEAAEPYRPDARESPDEQPERLRRSIQDGIREAFDNDDTDNN